MKGEHGAVAEPVEGGCIYLEHLSEALHPDPSLSLPETLMGEGILQARSLQDPVNGLGGDRPTRFAHKQLRHMTCTGTFPQCSRPP